MCAKSCSIRKNVDGEKRKKLMILGASILQLPAILKAKEMGIQVIALDIDKNAIGFKEADICLEISTIDVPKVIEAAKKHNIDGIMTLASDMPMRTVAAVARELNIVGIKEDTALKATHKGEMRECLMENNIPIPQFFRVNSYDEYLTAVQHFNSKFMVKPSDNSGSRGIFLVNDINDKQLVKNAYIYSKNNSRSGELLVEEYMEGKEVSVETLSIDGEIHVIAITDKLTTGSPRFVEMGHSQPSCLSEKVKKQIEDITIMAVKAIGIETGPSHTEIIVTTEGPKVVEIGARLGGDNITTHLVPLSTGVDMVQCCIEIALGGKPDIKPKINKGSAIRYFRAKTGQLISISGVESAKELLGVKQIFFMKKTGDLIEEAKSSSDRIGFVIAQSRDPRSAIKVCEDAIDSIKIEVNEQVL